MNDEQMKSLFAITIAYGLYQFKHVNKDDLSKYAIDKMARRYKHTPKKYRKELKNEKDDNDKL
jgi:hypothetical protein